MSMTRASVLRLVVFSLTFGFYTNIVMVVALSFTVKTADLKMDALDTNGPSYPEGYTWVNDWWEVSAGRGFGTLRIEGRRMYLPTMAVAMHESEWGMGSIDLLPPPLRAPFRETLSPVPDHSQYNRKYYHCRGWPFLAAWCEFFRMESAIENRVRGGIPLEYEPVDVQRHKAHGEWVGTIPLPRSIPYRPIWRGVLLNTLFYGTIMFALLFTAREARHRLRLRRSRCPNCNYILKPTPAAGCPECGWGRET